MGTENVKLENENCFGSKLSNTFQFLGFFRFLDSVLVRLDVVGTLREFPDPFDVSKNN